MAKKPAGNRKRGTPAASNDDEAVTGDPTETPIENLHIWQIQAVRDLLLVAAVIAIVWAGYALRAVTVPLLVALLLAYLFEPLIARMCSHSRISRAGAVTIVVTSFAATVAAVIAIALPFAIVHTANFVDDVRGGELRARVVKLEAHLPATFHDEFEKLIDFLPREAVRGGRPAGPTPSADPSVDPSAELSTEPSAAPDAGPDVGPDVAPVEKAVETAASITSANLERLIDERIDERIDARIDARMREPQAALPPSADGEMAEWQRIARGVRGALATVFSVVGTLVELGLLTFLIPFYFFFFSLWYPDVVDFLRGLLPERNRDRYVELLGKMDNVVAGFVRGRIVISLIMGVLLAIGWAAIGVPNPIMLGMIVGVFCAVPYLGAIGIPLAVGLLFLKHLGLPEDEQWAWYWILLWPSLWFGVVQLIEGYALTPLIAGKATNLDPVTILVVVLAGGSVLGVYGMLLAIPIAACGKIICTDVLLPKVRAWTRGEASDPLPIDRG